MTNLPPNQRKSWWKKSQRSLAQKRRDRFLQLESLEARELMIATPVKFDFGPSWTPVEAGSTQVTELTTYSAAQQFGWQTLVSPSSADNGTPALNDRRDYVGGTSGTFAADVANGTYDVTIGISGPYGTGDGKSNASIAIEGTSSEFYRFVQNSPYFERTYRTNVTKCLYPGMTISPPCLDCGHQKSLAQCGCSLTNLRLACHSNCGPCTLVGR